MARSLQSAASPHAGAASPPTGTLTFLFTDIEGSTERWERDRGAMQDAVRRHDAILRRSIESHGGYVFKTVGDAFHAAFAIPSSAIAAALDAQRALSAEDFAAVAGIRVRMALHSGTADERDGDYFGPTLNRTARLLAIGYGGQILLSGVTGELARAQLPAYATLQDLGAHRLKDLSRPEQVLQLLAPGMRNDFPPPRSLDSLPNNLPLQLTSFVGREAEVAEVTALLGKHRLVTLTGAGGVGKTRVSLQVGANLLDVHSDGVWFVEFAPLSDPSRVPTTIAQAVNEKLPSEGDPHDWLVTLLRAKQILIIFDNCEHLVDAVAAAASMLVGGCPRVSILASSRQGLAIAGEAAYRMPSLTLPPAGLPLSAQDALQFGAVALFAARAEAADARFALTDEVVPVVADICRRLDGIALAIELAAARVNILKPQDLRARLDQRFRLLVGGRRDSLPRQQTLRAMIDWSFDLLDERERLLFRRLGVFVDGFSLEGAVAVGCDEILDELGVFDVLASLVDKSLVLAELEGASTRYRLLESTRAYAREKLEAVGERAVVAKRHFDYISGIFRRASASYESAPREVDVAALAPELGDLRAALDWSEQNAPSAGAELLARGQLFSQLELFNEGAERAQRLVSSLTDDDAAVLARLWTFVAACEAGRFAAKSAFEAAERAVSYGRASRDPAVLADALLKYGRAATFRRRFDEAEAALHEAETIVELTPRRRLDLVRNRGVVLSFTGDLVGSMEACEQVRLLQKALGNARGECIAALNLAENEYMLGHTRRAIELGREALALALRIGDTSAAAPINQNLAGYLIAGDDGDGAHAAGRAVLQFYAKSDPSNAHVPVTLEHLALAYALDGDCERAARLEGYVEKTLPAVGYDREYTEIVTHDRLMALLRSRFDEKDVAVLFASGEALTPKEAIEEALRT